MRRIWMGFVADWWIGKQSAEGGSVGKHGGELGGSIVCWLAGRNQLHSEGKIQSGLGFKPICTFAFV